MREILFRAKNIDNGEWVEGMPWIFKDRSMICPWHKGMCKYDTGFYPVAVIPKTVGQYTGLTDKNGVKIFEGDICRNTDTGEIVSVKWHGTMAGYVWSKRKENSKYLYEFGALFRAFDKYEVIGNIFDNPELLKGGGE